ncbi:MAG TPA: hypothetical protein VK327_03150 [Candidatus Paceibacterota bacterium]|nr:hypothetical protein [Candidatus Paceibacterota bacterium]
METLNLTSAPQNTATTHAAQKVPFGVNAFRLNAWQWIATFFIVTLALVITPWMWQRVERFETGPDYRLPYQLSKDYWLYGRRVNQVIGQDKVLLLGDSAIWGEYVAPNGTLSHFLNEQAGATNRFLNLGLNGLFPLAQEGLVSYYGRSLQHEKIVVQFNFLWLTSPKADLSSDKEQRFNHTGLVPQFMPRIPCYRADANDRLSIVVQRNVPFLQWVGHLQNAYFDQKSFLSWTLADDGGSPAKYPNVYRNPLAQLSLTVPSAPADDPERGPNSERHKAWSSDGENLSRFEWVNLDASVQWQAFQRLIKELRARGNSVFVLVGPFNEHLIAEENRPDYRKLRGEIAEWLKQNQIPNAVPESLPSELYADGSHPLTKGYQVLAGRLYSDPEFQKWLK